MNLFLIGFMGCGKSSQAPLLSERLGLPVMEMDREIEERAGMTIREIFERFGEEDFRMRESGLLWELGDKSYVVSCGGGLPLLLENRRMMRESGRVIYLTATPETILKEGEKSARSSREGPGFPRSEASWKAGSSITGRRRIFWWRQTGEDRRRSGRRFCAFFRFPDNAAAPIFPSAGLLRQKAIFSGSDLTDSTENFRAAVKLHLGFAGSFFCLSYLHIVKEIRA